MKSLTDATFDTEIKQGTWLVQFWASWCGPCIDVTHLEEFEAAAPHISLGRVNVEENPDLNISQWIVAVPTYVVYKQGRPVKKVVGLQDKESLLEIIK